MKPDTKHNAAGENGGVERNAFDRWSALQKSTDTPRANLLSDIVGHPKGSPSVTELEYMNPDLGEDAIRRHLSVLKNYGVVEELVVPSGERIRGYPYKFYTLSGEAREMFDDNDLFPEDAWTRQYSRVEKTNEITELEQMPRPIHD